MDKIWVCWKNSLMSGFQFNPQLSSKNQMNKVYHTPQVCLSVLVIIFYFILSSRMYLQDPVLTFPLLSKRTVYTHCIRLAAKYIRDTVQICIYLFIKQIYQYQQICITVFSSLSQIQSLHIHAIWYNIQHAMWNIFTQRKTCTYRI